MKLREAREIGAVCGLRYDYEHVNNVIIHASSMFGYSEISEQLVELIQDAKKNKVRFAKCGHAEKRYKKLCYMCKQINRKDV